MLSVPIATASSVGNIPTRTRRDATPARFSRMNESSEAYRLLTWLAGHAGRLTSRLNRPTDRVGSGKQRAARELTPCRTPYSNIGD